MKLIIFIHTCSLYEKSRALLVEACWGTDVDIVFITDNPHSKLLNHIYIGPYVKGPTYHPTTVIKMFNIFLTKYSDYDFYMIVDDDAYVNVENLKTYLSFCDPSKSLMIGDYLNWTDFFYKEPYNDYTKWVGGGSGIVFTKSSIQQILKLNSPHCNHDVWLHSLYMKSDRTIQRIHCPGFYQFPPTDKRKIISVHLNHDMKLLDYFKN